MDKQGKPAVSQAYIEREVTLNSRFSQKAYARIFKSVSGSLYILGIVLRIIGTEDEAQSVESIVDNMLDDVESELENEVERLRVLMENNGLDDVSALYTSPVTYMAHVTSPRAARFLHMVETLDVIAARLDCLWLSSLLTDQQYSNAGYMWQRRVVRLANKVRETASRAVASSKNKGADTQKEVQKVIEKAGVDVEEKIEEEDSPVAKAA